MTEIEVTGSVVWKKFEPVNYKDKKTGEDKSTKNGQIVVEHERVWFGKDSKENKTLAKIAFDFFGAGAEAAEKVEVGTKVTVKANASANYWEKGDKWFSTNKAYDFKVEGASEDVPF